MIKRLFQQRGIKRELLHHPKRLALLIIKPQSLQQAHHQPGPVIVNRLQVRIALRVDLFLRQRRVPLLTRRFRRSDSAI